MSALLTRSTCHLGTVYCATKCPSRRINITCLFTHSVKCSKTKEKHSLPLRSVLWEHSGGAMHPPYLAGCTICSSGAAQWTSWRCGWVSSCSGGPVNVCRIIWLSNHEQSEQLHQSVSLPESHGNAKSSATTAHQTPPRKILFTESKEKKISAVQ